jgi:hypothetical protein
MVTVQEDGNVETVDTKKNTGKKYVVNVSEIISNDELDVQKHEYMPNGYTNTCSNVHDKDGVTCWLPESSHYGGGGKELV